MPQNGKMAGEDGQRVVSGPGFFGVSGGPRVIVSSGRVEVLCLNLALR
jgi:hypothetical protein